MPRLKLLQIDSNTICVLPLILLLATDPLFHPFAFGTESGFAENYIKLIDLITKLTGLAAVGILIISLRKFQGKLLFIWILLTTYLTVLIFESLYLYNSFIMYPHVILKLFNLIIALALFSYFSDRRDANVYLVINFIILGLLMKIALEPDMLSLQAFVSHERGLPAGSVLLLCLPCIYYFNRYITSQKMGSLLIFLFLFLFILIANHRTVWITISFSLLINFILIRNNVKLKIGKIVPAIFLVIIISVYTLILGISYSPAVGEKINTNITNILHPTEDSTGSWRVLQMQSYWPKVEENLLTGMRWKGFELPIQFYHPEAGTAYFEEGTGHHFHSFYFDKLFYFGILGLLIFMLILTLPIFYVIKGRLTLDNVQISFFIFSLSGLVYGISYNLDFAYWLIFGVTLMQVNLAFRKSPI